MIVISGTSNQELSRGIAKKLGTTLGKCFVGKFSDGEIKIQVKESVRGKDVFII